MTTTRAERAPRLAPLAPSHRLPVEQLLGATGAFRDDEIAVALEVFDAAFDEDQSDYALLGAIGDAGTLLGYACYGATPCTLGTWDLYWIAVHPTAQGQGVGTALMDEIERRVRDRDARLLVIETSSKSDYAATRGFYRARGYEAAARVPDFYDDGDDRVIYIKRLRSPKESA